MQNRVTENITSLKAHMRSIYGRSYGPSDISKIEVDIPTDYATFLSEIGGGVIGEMIFDVYDTPVSARKIYGDDVDVHKHLNSVTIIGDNFAGYCIGLDSDNEWQVVEVDLLTRSLEVVADNLFDFLTNNWRTDPSNEEH